MSSAGLLLWAIGLVLGWRWDRMPGTLALRSGEYFVVAADFHVHSFPGDGTLPPWDLAHEARRRGLDAIALTNHNQMLSSRVATLMPEAARDVLLLPGEELTTARYHLALVGISQPVDWRLPLTAATDAVHRQGGAAIIAHPVRDFWPALDASAIDAVDAVEVAHPIMFNPRYREELAAFYARAIVEHPGIAPIGSSDFHQLADVGQCRTYAFVTSRTVSGVVDAVRNHRTVACDAAGRTYGEPRLAAVVAAQCSAQARWRPGAGAANLASLVLTLTGVAALAFGTRPVSGA